MNDADDKTGLWAKKDDAARERFKDDSLSDFQKEYLNEPAGPNDYNGPLPAVPMGYTSWRQVYAHALQGLARFNPAGWRNAHVIFEGNGADVRPPKHDAVGGMMYTEIAHYAAREQAAEDAEVAPLDFMELRNILSSGMFPNTGLREKLGKMMEAAYRREFRRNLR